MKKTTKSREKVILKVYKRGSCHPFHKVWGNIITGFRGSRMIPALHKFCFLPVPETSKDPVAHGCVVKANIDLYSSSLQSSNSNGRS